MTANVIIPARGGSKGIINKNLQVVGSHRLIEHAIHASLDAEQVVGVYVSTDDQNIAAVAEDAGANVIMRPDELAKDNSLTIYAVLHAMFMIPPEHRLDVITLVQCTAFPQSPVVIDAVVTGLDEQNADCALSVREEINFIWRKDPAGYGYLANQSIFKPRQECQPEYMTTSAVFAAWFSWLKEKKTFWGGRMALIQDDVTVVDIDEPRDLELARAWAVYKGYE